MAELEDELIGDDLDYEEEYDLDEEQEEALLADLNDEQESETVLIQPEPDTQEEEEEVNNTQSVHSRLSLPPEKENYIGFQNELKEDSDLS
ncbi:hypothetical protein Anas_11604, partial [Armadillidium nasatum]